MWTSTTTTVPEKNGADIIEMTDFHPEFSHRYAALAAGIGRLGWSGNLLTREHGALVELGSVPPPPPLESGRVDKKSREQS